MCGFLGCVVKKEKSSSLLNNSLGQIHHRGPDHAAYACYKVSDLFVYLGHTRLSIIDLNDSANQPFESSCGNFVITFNGEIYNYKELRSDLQNLGYKFKTLSDTEVLLYAYVEWGQNCLTKLIGMFSFVFYNKQNNTITLARDAFGIKPFFYSIHDNELYFASEVQALLTLMQSQFKLNLQISYDYLVHGDCDSTEDTFIDGVKHLKPAHFITFDLDKKQASKPIRWWKPNITSNADIKFKDAALKLRELFLDSVRLHLRSDVSLGFAMSGGVDSSAIVSAARYLEPSIELKTFSYIDSDKKISEEPWIDLINKKMNTTSHKVNIKEKEFISDFDDMILSQGEPFGGLSIYAQYRVFKLAKENGIKVILDGQGADELLAGYDGYPGHRLLSIIETKGWWAAHKFAKRWSKYPGRNYLLAWKHFARIKFTDKVYRLFRKIMGRNFEPSWLKIQYLKNNGVKCTERRQKFCEINKGLRVKEALAYSLIHRGLRSLLRVEDRNSMKFSIENRVPFLTIPIAEFLLSLPEEFLISEDGVTKNVFREAMRGIMPDSHIDRKDKIGFEVSDAKLLISMSGYFRKLINEVQEIYFIDKENLIKIFEEFENGTKVFNKCYLRWIIFLRWQELLVKKIN
jgi:asparagine synthase (glutamine-hydrolysing)